MSVSGPVEDFVEEAKRLVSEAEKRGIILRVMGAVAVRIHCERYGHLLETMKRELSDIDFMSYSKFRNVLPDFFKEMGYTPRERIILLYGTKRHIYDDFKHKRFVDVFFDVLDMCHLIDFRGRLELDSPTITLADIVLEKMQIVKINEKDIKDVIVLLREHDLGGGRDQVDIAYIADILSKDWGFYYTVTTNLKKVKAFLPKYEALTDEDREDVAGKIDAMLDEIERHPKTLKWKMRARIGTKKKWYKEVEEVVR